MQGGGQQLSAHNAAEYLQLVRSFKGLEAPVAGMSRLTQQQTNAIQCNRVPAACAQLQEPRSACGRLSFTVPAQARNKA
eukprot:1152168-Pelagomonas_calceolata.AAC.14